MTESRNEQITIKAIQNMAHQLERMASAFESIAKSIELVKAEEEQRWTPEGYDDENGD